MKKSLLIILSVIALFGCKKEEKDPIVYPVTMQVEVSGVTTGNYSFSVRTENAGEENEFFYVDDKTENRTYDMPVKYGDKIKIVYSFSVSGKLTYKYNSKVLGSNNGGNSGSTSIVVK